MKITLFLAAMLMTTLCFGDAADDLVAMGGDIGKAAREVREHPFYPGETTEDYNFRRMIEKALEAGTMTPAQAAQARAQYAVAKAQRDAANAAYVVTPNGDGTFTIQKQQ